MAIFYDLDQIEKESAGNLVKFMDIIKYLSLGTGFPPKPLARVRFDIIKSGNSFIRNPLGLVVSKVDIEYKVQYVRLAALRDYTYYKLYKSTALLRSYYPDLDIDKIKHNPLLKITQSEIHFTFEE